MTDAQTDTDIDAVLAEAEALASEGAGDTTTIAPEPPASQDTYQETDLDTPQRPAARQRPQGPVDRVLKLRVPVIVRLAERKMRLSEVLTISAGSIVEFEKPFDASLDLLVNNKQVGQGQAVKVGEQFGLRVVTIGSLRDKVDALADG
jgi:flagellar motor switch protein FliN/FliY